MASKYEYELQDLILEAEDAISHAQEKQFPYAWLERDIDVILEEVEVAIKDQRLKEATYKLLISLALIRRKYE